MDFLIKTKDNLLSGRWIEQTCVALVFFNSISLLASFHWAFDLFVNFKPQYLVGSVLLFILCVIYRYKWFALCMAILAIALFIEIQFSYSKPFAARPAQVANFAVVQYNKFYYNDNYEDIGAWLRSNDFDVVVVNETLHDAIEPLQKFKDAYPYQFPQTRAELYDDLFILSRSPITVMPLPMTIGERTYVGSRITVKKKGLEPVVIYAFHANVPMGNTSATRRNFQLESLATMAGEEKAKNVIMMGDWNLTPYSPLFKNILKISGLTYQNYGLFPQTTWPSFNYFEFLKIPIDHIIFNNNMLLTDIRKGPSLGADHQSLVARFYINEEESAASVNF
jgi:endonuclease/exonuclease/phosphatase (EEP) superfamily protein YafD